MAVLSSDLQLRLSGGAGNSDVNASLGGVMSSVAVVDNTIHNLFDRITSSEATAGVIDYRCIFVRNNASQTAYAVKLSLPATPTPSTYSDISIALDSASGTPAQTIADELTAPTSVTWSQPTSVSPLLIGNMSAGAVKAVWIRRTILANATGFANDNVVLTIDCDTAS